MSTQLILAIGITGVLAIGVRYQKEHLYKFFKPLPILILIGVCISVMLAAESVSTIFLLIFIGLLLGLGGDLFLLKEKLFIAGLASFLAGHIAYAVAFYMLQSYIPTAMLVALFFLAYAGCFILTMKLRQKGKQKYVLPVCLYVIFIVIMLITALNADFYLAFRSPLLFLGALVFCVSDLALAINKFISPFKAVHLIVLSTYYSAQTLIIYGAISYGL